MGEDRAEEKKVGVNVRDSSGDELAWDVTPKRTTGVGGRCSRLRVLGYLIQRGYNENNVVGIANKKQKNGEKNARNRQLMRHANASTRQQPPGKSHTRMLQQPISISTLASLPPNAVRETRPDKARAG